ncbi:MAG: hypothetical protein AAFW46_06540 [Pseudomonadota bacterium]
MSALASSPGLADKGLADKGLADMGLTDPAVRDVGADQIAPGLRVSEIGLGANVTATAASPAGGIAGLGDGRVVRIVEGGAEEIARHDAAVVSLSALGDGRVVSAGQDGRVLLSGRRAPVTLFDAKGEWINACVVHEKARQVAAAYGRTVVLIDDDGVRGRFSEHPSTVSGLGFSPTGDRLAASRYDGVSLWTTNDLAAPTTLPWKGSMLSAVWSPDGRWIVGATQDRELHVWDLLEDKDYRLGGFRAKVRGVGWTGDSARLVCTGADVIAAWPIAGRPGAFPPVEIGYVCEGVVTAIAAGGPSDRIAGGFSNGAILIGDARSGVAMIARAAQEAEITSLAWSPSYDRLYYGARDGAAGEIALA